MKLQGFGSFRGAHRRNLSIQATSASTVRQAFSLPNVSNAKFAETGTSGVGRLSRGKLAEGDAILRLVEVDPGHDRLHKEESTAVGMDAVVVVADRHEILMLQMEPPARLSGTFKSAGKGPVVLFSVPTDSLADP